MPTVTEIRLKLDGFNRDLDESVKKVREAKAKMEQSVQSGAAGAASPSSQASMTQTPETAGKAGALAEKKAALAESLAEKKAALASEAAAEKAALAESLAQKKAALAAELAEKKAALAAEAAAKKAALAAEAGAKKATFAAEAGAASQKIDGQFGGAAEKISQTGGATKNLSGNMKEAAGKISRAGSAVGALSGALGGINPQLAVVGQAITALVTGPIGILTFALGAMIAVGIKSWDYLTLSAEEYTAKLERSTSATQKMRETVDKQSSTAQEYLNRLRDLSSAESLSNEGKKEAARLVSVLTKNYGDLGLSIDAVSGKVNGFDTAQRALDVRTAQRRIGAARKESSAVEAESNNRFDVAMKEFGGLFGGIVSELFAGAEVADFKEKFKTATPEKQLNALRRMQENATTTDDVEKIQKLIDLKERQLALEKQIKMLEKHQVGSEDELDAKERAATDRANAIKAAADAKAKTEQDKKDALAKVARDLEEQRIFETQYQLLMLDNEYAKAEALKLQYELKQKNLNLSEQEKAVLEKQLALQGELNLEQKLKTDAEQLYDSALRQSGRSQEADLERMMREAKATKKGDLTPGEIDNVKRIAELTSSLGELAELQRDRKGVSEIETNELTARGGFSTGVVDKGDVNKEILDNAKQTNLLLQEIKKLTEDANRT